jgi:outer membrane protein OmpA-like peptidoglycan-associated protein
MIKGRLSPCAGQLRLARSSVSSAPTLALPGGGDAYNQKLSERRAASVKQWLTEKEGLDTVKLSTQGFGAKRPVAPNIKPDGSDDPEGRQKNRRVEIVLAK